MALSATFAADFKSFTDACAKAEVSLKGIEAGAGNVGTKLDKMANSLTGTKLIQQAALMAEAVDRVGGVATLTDRELARLGPTAIEAADKLRKLGQDVPPGIQKIADAAKRAEEPIAGLGVKTIALGTFFGDLGAKAVTNLGHFVADSLRSAATEFIHLGERGAAVNDITDAFNRLSQSGPNSLKALRDGIGGLLTDVELMKSANAALSAGWRGNEKDLYTVARAAWVLSDAQGKDLKESYDTILQSLATGKTAALGALGVTAEQKGASMALKAALDQEGEAVSTNAQKQANRQAAIEALNRVVLAAGNQELDFAEKLKRAKVQLDNMEDSIGAAIASSPVLGKLLDYVGDQLQKAFGANQRETVKAIATVIDQGAIVLVSFAQAAVTATKYAGEAFYAFRAVVFQVLGSVADEIQLLTQSLLAVARVGASIPGPIGAAYSAIVPTLRDVNAQTLGIAKSFHQTAIDAVKDAGQWGAGADVVSDSLGKLKAQMIAAAATGATEKAINDALAHSHQELGDSIAKTTGAEKQWADAVKKAGEDADILSRKLVNLQASHLTEREIVEREGKDATKLVETYQELGLSLSRLDTRIVALSLSERIHEAVLKTTTKTVSDAVAQYLLLNQHFLKLPSVFTAAAVSVKDVSDKLIGQTHAMEYLQLQFGRQTIANKEFTDEQKKAAQAAREQADAVNLVADIIGTLGDRITGTAGATLKAAASMVSAFERIASAATTAEAAAGWFGLLLAAANYLEALNRAKEAQKEFNASVQEGIRVGKEFNATWSVSHDTLAAIQSDFNQVLAALVLLGQAEGKVSVGQHLMLEDFLRLMGLTREQVQAMAEALHLTEIIANVGGLTADNIHKFEQAAENLFRVIELGGPLAVQAQKELNDSVQQFLNFADKTGGLWDANLKKIIADAKAAGIELESVNAAIAAQLDKLSKGTNAQGGQFTVTIGSDFKTRTGFSLDDFNKIAKRAQDLTVELSDEDKKRLAYGQATIAQLRIDYQGEFDRISRITLASFNAYIAQGKSAVDAIQALGPGLDQLIAAADQFGFAGSAAFDQLSRWRGLVKNNEELLNSVSGLNDIMLALANLGSLNADTFADLETQAGSTFDKLIAAGFTTNEALVQMKPFLETVLKLQKEQGFVIDDNTKKLIAQAQDQGILTGEQLSTNDILLQGLSAVITALGGTIPDAFKTMADKGADAAKRLKQSLDNETKTAADLVNKNLQKIEPVTVPVNYDFPYTQSPNGTPEWGGAQAMGGDYFVKKPTLFLAGEAGPERVTFGGAHQAFRSGDGEIVIINKTYLDGRQVAESTARHLPRVLKGLQVTRP